MRQTHDLLRGVLAEGHAFEIAAVGGSMRPLLRSGDRVRVQPIRPAQLRRGDIAVISRGGSFVAHRVAEIGSNTVVLRGDDCPSADPPIALNEVLGRVTAVRRGAREIEIDGAVGRILSLLSRLLGPLRAQLRGR